MRNCLASVSLAAILLSVAHLPSAAQSLLPDVNGETVKYNAVIAFPRGEMSGILALRNDGGVFKGCVFNEFGISALDFTYRPGVKKVEIVHAANMLDKWYIKRVLRRDLAAVTTGFGCGDSVYTNEKRHITYQFSHIANNDSER